MNKDTGKLCEFHKIPTQNTNECRDKQPLVVELKALESDTCSNIRGILRYKMGLLRKIYNQNKLFKDQ